MLYHWATGILSENEIKNNCILYFYINNVINILFIKAKDESHEVSFF